MPKLPPGSSFLHKSDYISPHRSSPEFDEYLQFIANANGKNINFHLCIRIQAKWQSQAAELSAMCGHDLNAATAYS